MTSFTPDDTHAALAYAESAALTPSAWERWALAVELLLGHSLDGDESTDGYSMDGAYEAWEAGTTPSDHGAHVRDSSPRGCRIERTSLGGGVICAECGDACECMVCAIQ